ncbi:MAG: WbqC family protein [Candidatus Omnitrophica bacterium]|nr:WbqC family protein [Candidatus Omnitrophota bacterium]
MIVSVHQPQYLPWLGYLDKIKKSDCFVFLDRVQYKHREFENRNKIRTKKDWLWLTVPVVTKNLRNQLISDVKIDNSVNWKLDHWKAIKLSYAHAPFFNDYSAFFEDVYLNKDWDKLLDLNVFIIKYLLKEFGIKTPLCFESEIGTTKASTERIIEICKKLNSRVYLSGSGGRDYLDEKKFAEEGLELRYQEFEHPIYQQCFMKDNKGFISHMAAIDLLFNEGKAAKSILFK